MYKYFSILLICTVLWACDNNSSKLNLVTINSTDVNTLKEKTQLIKKYIAADRQYTNLEYRILYRDNSKGLVPGPSDWSVDLVATVPVTEVDKWIEGKLITKPEKRWLNYIAKEIYPSTINEWYVNGFVLVGVDRTKGIVAYQHATR